MILNELCPNKSNNDLALLLHKLSADHGISFYKINTLSGVIGGTKIKFPNDINPFATLNFSYLGNQVISTIYFIHLQSPFFRKTLVSLDLTTGECWGKQLLGYHSFGQSTSFTSYNEDNIIVGNTPTREFGSTIPSMSHPYPDSGVVEIFSLDLQGNMVWKNGFIFSDEVSSLPFNTIIKDIGTNAQGDIFATGVLKEKLTFYGGEQFILKLSNTGQPLVWKTIEKTSFGEMVISSDGVYILDKGVQPGSIYSLDYLNPDYSLLVKLDHNLNFLWARKYFGDNFLYADAEISLINDGNLLMAHSTKGAFPVILTEIDEQGEIVSQRGYPNYTPSINIMQDGSLLMASYGSALDSAGNLTDFLPVLAKTDPNGNIDGCTTFPTCLMSSDTTIEMGSFLIEPYPIFDLVDLDVHTEPREITLRDFCDFPPPPIPDFFVPDTLCEGSLLLPTGTSNHFAHARQWHLTGPGVDSLLNDSLGFVYHLAQAGEYKLAQAVWVLGCRSDYERTFMVIPRLEATIEQDIFCPDSPAVVNVTVNRPATSISWSNGQTTPSLPIQMGGTYAVTVSDGACTASDIAEITLVDELLGGLPALNLPSDTTICFTDLPFTLTPASAFTDTFFLQTNLTPAQSFQLEAAGHYRIGASVFGCTIWEDFNLEVDCHADVYVPNAFSPNGDGINDLFRPYGTDFEVLEMVIYDRWGGERYRAKGQSAAWDGGGARQGVFTYRIKYLDLLNRQEKELVGEVVLMK